jgi:uncharacterized membrane protein
VLFNAIARLFNWYDVIKDGSPKRSMKGYCSIYLTISGIIAGFLLYVTYLIPLFRNINFILLYALIGMVTITGIELLTGYLFNIKLNMQLWNYSKEPLNYKGQISIIRSIGWLLLSFIIYFVNAYIYLM